ncbi:helix-turn-helix transcriptional regulator [Ramlibacter sp. XY19]|uniref:winged helix-turn-helix transcriptional regulator n=1 Tax=Ramlibacter paludis TaxID=2908000 RepID=UPI0023DB055D|nr:helix-turn-helix domain-containing protein [Ramlibacter paludis]MCG2594884.1 helix-turn-helix transcriptional regulator [Ramlibacter paludis]
MQGYGQFCTVARGAEVLCERWTPLVIRELLIGSHRFNDLHRGVPRMSTSLLAQRLRQLEECGVVERHAVGKVWEYHLTAAGEELRPLIMGLGQWGARWIGSRLREGELDAGLLLWDMRRSLRLAEFPPQPVVVQFLFRDGHKDERKWWLVVEAGTADLCREDPGREITLVLDATLRALTEIWSGDDTPQQAMAAGDLRVLGPQEAAGRLWNWLGVGTFAQARRARPVAVAPELRTTQAAG